MGNGYGNYYHWCSGMVVCAYVGGIGGDFDVIWYLMDLEKYLKIMLIFLGWQPFGSNSVPMATWVYIKDVITRAPTTNDTQR